MNDFHRNKYLLGELTMEEYYELAKFPPIAALEIRMPWGNQYFNCHEVGMTGDDIAFMLAGDRRGDVVLVPRSSKVKVDGNQVTTKDNAGKEVAIRFFNIVPTPNPIQRRRGK